MRGFLLDTNVISELHRPRPEAAVVAFVAAQPEDALFVSEVTFGQLDLFIAATAAEEELVVVSRDAAHFLAAGVPILDPWTGTYTSGTGRGSAVPDLASPDLLASLAAFGAP